MCDPTHPCVWLDVEDEDGDDGKLEAGLHSATAEDERGPERPLLPADAPRLLRPGEPGHRPHPRPTGVNAPVRQTTRRLPSTKYVYTILVLTSLIFWLI